MPDIRFYAPELQDSSQFKEAVAKNRGVNITIRQSETDMSRVWFALPDRGLTSIPNVSSDEDLKDMGTVVDLLQWADERALAKAMQRGGEDQQGLEKLQRRGAITNRGKAELKEILVSQRQKPSKKSTVSDLRKNRDEEMQALKSGGEPNAVTTEETPQTDAVVETDRHDEAASDAMDAFMQDYAA